MKNFNYPCVITSALCVCVCVCVGMYYGDNLITDGGIENSDALGSSANQGKPWYYQNAYVFSGCTGLSF